MPYLRIAEARAMGQAARRFETKSAGQILSEEARGITQYDSFHVFLSHSYDDAEIILGVKRIMEASGLKVYVDWSDDGNLDRNNVTAATADVLRSRMRQSRSLCYAHSPNTPDSRWMPWELGYFDGFRPSFVWILPLVRDYDHEFKGQEYLGLYPTIHKIAELAGRLTLGIPDVSTSYGRKDILLSEAAKAQEGIRLTTSA